MVNTHEIPVEIDRLLDVETVQMHSLAVFELSSHKFGLLLDFSLSFIKNFFFHILIYFVMPMVLGKLDLNFLKHFCDITDFLILVIYLESSMTEMRKLDKELFHLPIYCPNGCNCWGCVVLKPGGRNPRWEEPSVGTQIPALAPAASQEAVVRAEQSRLKAVP